MSCTLSYRKTPSNNNWKHAFKCSLRDKLYKRFGAGNAVVTREDVPYLEGIRDGSSDKDDIEHLDNMIEILSNDNTIDFSYDC